MQTAGKDMNRRAKIVGTIGPAVDADDTLLALIEAGLDVARINFSHGTHAEHGGRIARVRAASERLGRPVAILQDLCGPKIRTGRFDTTDNQAEPGAEVRLIEGKRSAFPCIAIDWEGFAQGLQRDDRLLLDDGRIALRVTELKGDSVLCVVETPGRLRDNVGVHLPARSIRGATFTDKDREDLRFGLAQGVDYVAMSFVRSAEDLREVRAFCRQHGRDVPLIAKIETPPAIEDLDRVVEASDGVMVARGDLGVEYPPEHVPVLQRRIIAAAHAWRKPVIVATEMLQSMVSSSRPTRAEASDVAHAVFDDTDAVMLSAETAIGAHPVLAVQTMARIIVEAEQSVRGKGRRLGTQRLQGVAESVAFNAADIAEEVGAQVLVAFTRSGDTARLVSMARPAVAICAFSSSAETCRRVALLWGVKAWLTHHLADEAAMMRFAGEQLLASGLASPGQTFVTVFGAPADQASATNSLSVRVVG